MNDPDKMSVLGNLAISNILNLIRIHAPITRAQLGQLSGYSRSTISLNCDKLLQTGLVKEKAIANTNGIGKRTQLQINGNAGICFGIELGATSCDIGVCSLSAELIDYNSSPITLETGPEPIFFLIHKTIQNLLEKNNLSEARILGIGMGLPTPVDYQKGAAVHPAFMPGWHMYPVKEIMQKKYGCPVFVDNEVNTMALGEYSLGISRQYKNLLFIKVGTGIGAGIIVNGELYRGENGFAGNIGHIQVEGNEIVCSCGRKGCLEALAGGEAITKKAIAIIESGESTILKELYEQKGYLTPKEVKKAAELGDMKCISLIKESALLLGKILGKLEIFFNPAIIIIGGGVSGLGQTYISFIRDGIIQQSAPWIASELIIQPSTFGDKSGIIGSAVLCINELFLNGFILSQFLLDTRKEQ